MASAPARAPKSSLYYNARIRRAFLSKRKSIARHYAYKFPQSYRRDRSLELQNKSVASHLQRFFGANESITLQELLVRLKKRKRALRLLELGAGTGEVLRGLVLAARAKTIPTDATALTLPDSTRASFNQLLEENARTAQGEKAYSIVEAKAEEFIPTKKYDFIFDSYGPMSYTLRRARKDLLLKYAHSLHVGGVMIVRFDAAPERSPSQRKPTGKHPFHVIAPTLSSFRAVLRQPFEEEVRGIERALQKQGFRAQIRFDAPAHPNEKGPALMAGILILQRER